MKPENPYPIGTKFILKRPKFTREYTVTDYLSTFNSAGELVKWRYVTTHEFMGQIITNCDVVHTTIRMAELKQGDKNVLNAK